MTIRVLNKNFNQNLTQIARKKSDKKRTFISRHKSGKVLSKFEFKNVGLASTICVKMASTPWDTFVFFDFNNLATWLVNWSLLIISFPSISACDFFTKFLNVPKISSKTDSSRSRNRDKINVEIFRKIRASQREDAINPSIHFAALRRTFHEISLLRVHTDLPSIWESHNGTLTFDLLSQN